MRFSWKRCRHQINELNVLEVVKLSVFIDVFILWYGTRRLLFSMNIIIMWKFQINQSISIFFFVISIRNDLQYGCLYMNHEVIMDRKLSFGSYSSKHIRIQCVHFGRSVLNYFNWNCEDKKRRNVCVINALFQSLKNLKHKDSFESHWFNWKFHHQQWWQSLRKLAWTTITTISKYTPQWIKHNS